MNEDEFEWDAAKAESNLAKHGVTFEAAQYVFKDVFACEQWDVVSDPSETRYLITGLVNDVIDGRIYRSR